MPTVTFTDANVVRSDGVRVYGQDRLLMLNTTNDTIRNLRTGFGIHSADVDVAIDTDDVTFTFDNDDDAAWFSQALLRNFVNITVSPSILATGTSVAGNLVMAVGAGGYGTGIADKAFTGAANVITFTDTTPGDLGVAVGTGRDLYLRLGQNPIIPNITGHDDDTTIENTGGAGAFVDYWMEEGTTSHGTAIARSRGNGEVYILSDSSAPAH